MPLSLAKIKCMEIVSASTSVSSNHFVLSVSLETYSQSLWLCSSESPDPLADTFLCDESIMEVISLEEVPWNETHHRSSFLPGPMVMSTCLEKFFSWFTTQPLQMLIMTHEVWSEGNMCNITQTMLIDISIKPGVIENVHIGVNYSHDDIKLYTRLSNNAEMFSHGHMRKFSALTQV